MFPTEVVLSSFPSLPELRATLAGWMGVGLEVVRALVLERAWAGVEPD